MCLSLYSDSTACVHTVNVLCMHSMNVWCIKGLLLHAYKLSICVLVCVRLCVCVFGGQLSRQRKQSAPNRRLEGVFTTPLEVWVWGQFV